MGRKTTGRFHGFLVVDKPAGWTSHDVVGRVRRLLGERRVGHAGTLDPAATGVLPVAVGDATKVLEWLDGAAKTYVADVTFGVSTDSADIDGVVIATEDVSALDRAAVEAALASFRGPIDQTPPMHSAIKVGGTRLYELARAGMTIDRQPRSIVIHELQMHAWSEATATLLVHCSKGSYIRALAQDLGDAVGYPAYLSNLVRVVSGPFTLAEAWTIAELSDLDLQAEWETVALHPDQGLEDVPAIVLSRAAGDDWSYGRPIEADDAGASGIVRVYSADGAWIGVAEHAGDPPRWRPARVVSDAA